jgi:ParB family transcriptional regulator, chromosome partitioning protein
MMNGEQIQFVLMSEIRVLNPRTRSRAKFLAIVENISKVGLKKPITVSKRRGGAGFDLVCGQGRLEALEALGESEVPAIIIDVSRDDRYVMSLVENIGRRPPGSLEFVREVLALKKRGHANVAIARKLGVSESYVGRNLRLYEQGEERLLRAVERSEIPITVALQIAAAKDEDIQRCLHDAYSSGQLRGKALGQTRRVLENRRRLGKKLAVDRGSRRSPKKKLSADAVVHAYNKEVKRQVALVRKAKICEQRLTFVQSALRELFADGDFKKLLHAEGLGQVPKYIHDRARGQAT